MTQEEETPKLNRAKIAYSVAEAAQAIGVSADKLRRIIRSGYLPAVTPPGFSRPLIRAADLQELLDAGE